MDAVILSSADILRILGGDAIIRQEARVISTEGRPSLGIDDTVYVYIEKYPTIKEFEATWRIWVQDNSGMGEYVLNAMTALLPNFDFNGDHYTTTDFASERTVIKTQEQIERDESRKERAVFAEQFTSLQEGLQARLGEIRNGLDGIDGRDGRDGKDGLDGRDGRDGRDLSATETDLFDLRDVDESAIPLGKGQVLMYDGFGWTNRFVPQMQSIFAGGKGGEGEGVIISDNAPAARDDGSPLQEGDQWWSSSDGVMYVWYVDDDGGQWVQSSSEGGGSSDVSVISDLLDVDTETYPPVAGQALIWDGSQWAPGDVSGGGGGGGASACDGILDGGDADTGLSNGVDCIDSIDDLPDVDTSTTAPEIGDSLVWNGTEWAPGAVEGGVTSVAGKTGDVTLVKTDITDFSDADYATAAQGLLADAAVQPGDNLSTLTNDAGFITLAEVPASGIPEAPQDGEYYVRQNGAWVSLQSALDAINGRTVDGGNLTTDTSAGDGTIMDGGVIT